MAQFPPEIIARIKDETDIVDLVGGYVRLKSAGSSYKGLCPFHGEKTPSFNVNPARQTYKCFGCGEGGDAISFLMAIEGIGFPEAVETLARTLDIDLAQYLQAGSDEGEKRAFHRANEVASELFREAYREPQRGRRAREYLEGRGFKPEILDRFDVGFAPAGDWLPRQLARRGVSEELAVSAGLLRQGERGGSFAYFRDRVIFPIRNISRQIAGFGGRVLGQGEPKYLNSADNPYFSKGRLLYGFDASRMIIARQKQAVLVEGYLDLIALAQAGIAGVVANCGTAFTPEQARLLRRGARRVVMLFDGDLAGRKAAVKSCHLCLATGLEAAVAQLPAGKDPADLVMEEGPEAVSRVIEGAVPYLEFLRAAVSAVGDDRGALEKGAHQALATIAEVPDPIRRELMLQETADLFGLPVDVLKATLAEMREPRRAPRRGAARDGRATAPDPTEDEDDQPTPEAPARRGPAFRTLTGVRRELIEAVVLAHALRDRTGEAARTLAADAGEIEFASPAAGALASELVAWAQAQVQEGSGGEPADFVQQRWHDRDAGYRRYVTDLMERQDIPEEGDFSRAVREGVDRLRRARQFG